MIHKEPKDLDTKSVHQLLLGGVSPRPIALVSTVSADGIVNLSPFSFFNAFGANPPIVAFSPSTRGRDGTKKDTYHNILAVEECVIQCVTYDMVQQVSLSSTEYEPGVDEFVKAGLTPVPSDLVKPPRVAESPFQMECRLTKMVHLGTGPGSGNLAICEVLKFHVAEDLLVDGIIDPSRIDLVGRNGGNWYTRANGKALFEVRKPLEKQGIGFDHLPAFLLASRVLTANNLAQLANCEQMPTDETLARFVSDLKVTACTETSAEAFERAARANDARLMLRIALEYGKANPHWYERAAHVALDQDDVDLGWMAVLIVGAVTEQ